MNTNKKFVTILELFVITLLVMSVVPVCGLNVSLADISAYPSIVNPDDEITVTFSGAPGFYWDRIAMYKVGDPNEEEYEGAGFYLEGEKSGTLIFTAPDEPGDYEFRLFELFEFTDIARSNVVKVQDESTQTSEETIVLFEENFDDGYAPGFGNEVGNWEVHLLDPYTGKYTATTDTYRFSMAGDTNWQDYVIEADFFNAQDGGLLVRAQDQDNCIALIVRPSYNDIYWYVRKGGMWADYKGQVTLGHEPGEELQVKVEVVGSEFKAYVNDVLKTTVENTEFPKGKIGLYLYYQPDQYWDNVVVYSSGATGPAPTPTPTPAITLTPTTTPATTQPTTPPVTPPEFSDKGDCNGDGEITAVDALCALQMAVGKRAEDRVMDVNGDGKVSSLDARKILRVAAGLEELP